MDLAERGGTIWLNELLEHATVLSACRENVEECMARAQRPTSSADCVPPTPAHIQPSDDIG